MILRINIFFYCLLLFANYELNLNHGGIVIRPYYYKNNFLTFQADSNKLNFLSLDENLIKKELIKVVLKEIHNDFYEMQVSGKSFCYNSLGKNIIICDKNDMSDHAWLFTKASDNKYRISPKKSEVKNTDDFEYCLNYEPKEVEKIKFNRCGEHNENELFLIESFDAEKLNSEFKNILNQSDISNAAGTQEAQIQPTSAANTEHQPSPQNQHQAFVDNEQRNTGMDKHLDQHPQPSVRENITPSIEKIPDKTEDTAKNFPVYKSENIHTGMEKKPVEDNIESGKKQEKIEDIIIKKELIEPKKYTEEEGSQLVLSQILVPKSLYEPLETKNETTTIKESELEKFLESKIDARTTTKTETKTETDTKTTTKIETETESKTKIQTETITSTSLVTITSTVEKDVPSYSEKSLCLTSAVTITSIICKTPSGYNKHDFNTNSNMFVITSLFTSPHYTPDIVTKTIQTQITASVSKPSGNGKLKIVTVTKTVDNTRRIKTKTAFKTVDCDTNTLDYQINTIECQTTCLPPIQNPSNVPNLVEVKNENQVDSESEEESDSSDIGNIDNFDFPLKSNSFSKLLNNISQNKNNVCVEPEKKKSHKKNKNHYQSLLDNVLNSDIVKKIKIRCKVEDEDSCSASDQPIFFPENMLYDVR